ncbi:MAG: TonB-dependent siderophore receptor, partial [Methylovulum sp.]
MTTCKKISRKRPLQAALLGAAISVFNPAQAAPPAQYYAIPGGSLATALNRLAEAGNLQLVYDTNIANGLKTSGLNGNYTTDRALRQLLNNSGLSYRIADNGTVVIEKSGNPTSALPPQSDAGSLPVVNVVGLQNVDANSPYNTDYHRTDASTATKTDTPIMETPFAVTVVPQQVLKDQRFIRVEDGLKNVAGVQPGFTNGGDSDTFQMRGFQNDNLYRDGFLLPSALGGGTLKRQTANLERIEVLKGPGSILYGRNQPGGVINLVTKRPQATPYHSVEQQFGSYDFYRTLVDSTGAITSDDELLYRVNLSYENADSFRDFVKTDTVFLAPSFTWNVTDQTQANLDIEYQHFDNTNDSGIPPLGSRPAPVPINRQTGDPFNNKTVGDRTYVGANWSHEFNDDWKLNHRFGAEFLDMASDFTFFFSPTDAAGNLVNVNNDFSNGGTRGFNNGTTQQQEYYTTLNLNGKFDTAMLEHSMLWGFDYFVIDNQGSSACCAAFPVGANFNVFNPTYLTSSPNLSFTNSPDMNQEWYGLYLQDQIKFPFNVYGNVGVRYDNATGSNLTEGIVTTDDDRVSPRGGLLWKPLQWLSVYGNYSENFGPSNSLFNAPGQQALPPQTAEEWELGAKTEFFDGRLSASFAYFDLTRQNMSVPDPINPNLQVAIGEQESRGYEFEAAGEILPGWNLIGAYTHLAYANINEDVGFD